MSGITLPVKINSLRLLLPGVNLYYPQVYGMRDMYIQNKVNRYIYAQVHKIMIDQGYYQSPGAEVTGFYQIKTNQEMILSLSNINYTFAGGAHGMTIVKSLTFDMNTGRAYRLKELFKPGTDYVKRLSEIVATQIKERNIDLLEPFTAIRSDQDYYIADKSLVIYFQLYEITAYAYGLQYFPISIYSIQDIINENGPLGRMLASY